jgi:hypothetical protein
LLQRLANTQLTPGKDIFRWNLDEQRGRGFDPHGRRQLTRVKLDKCPRWRT